MLDLCGNIRLLCTKMQVTGDNTNGKRGIVVVNRDESFISDSESMLGVCGSSALKGHGNR